MAEKHSTVAPASTPRRRGDVLISKALATLDRRLRQASEPISSPYAVREFLQLHLAERKQEVFMALFLDAGNCMIEWRELFRGTLSEVSVYPREVLRAAMYANAAAVIFAHNHPSGRIKASPADIAITRELKAVLAMVDVKVLDHFIIGGKKGSIPLSMAELGLV